MNKSHHNFNPPPIALRFFRWFCRPEIAEDIEGDLHENFQRNIEDFGLKKAQWKFTAQIFKLFRPGIVRLPDFSLKSNLMLRHHLLITWRSIKRNKNTFLINMVGLSTSLACVLLIYLWIQDELNTDKFHANDERIYQVIEHQNFNDGIQTLLETSAPMAEYLVDQMPEVEYAAAAILPSWFGNHLLSTEEKKIKATGQIITKDYFQIFSYPLLQGDKEQVMQDPNSVALSEDLAKSLFGTTENIIGKTVEFEESRQFRVTGIFANIPQNSTVQFDFALSAEASKTEAPWTSLYTWESSGTQVYILLKEGADIDLLNEKVAGIRKKMSENTIRTATLVPYSSLYLHGKFENGKQGGGKIQYVRLFSVVAIIILIIACINFMNLTTAQASTRLREIGIKKVVGAKKKTLIYQFLTESIFMSFLALGFAVLIVWYLLPRFNLIVGKTLSLYPDINLIGAALAIVLATGLIAGSYPALYLSSINTLTVLKDKISVSPRDSWTRKGLVIIQFTTSIVLIFSVMVIYLQIRYVLRQDMGYDQDQIVYFDIEGKLRNQLQPFESHVRNFPGVQNVSSTTHSMVGHNWSWGMGWEGKDPESSVQFQVFGVDDDFVETMGMEMISGRSFSKGFGTDSAGVIVNETAIKAMGLEDPLGKKVANGSLSIVGVVKDFHFKSLHDEISPIVMMFMPQSVKYVMVRIEAGKEKQVLDQIQKFYAEYNPGFPFEYKFLDEKFQAQYMAEKRVSVLSKYFAGLAIVISCLGLLGLAIHTTAQRTKEIGIRKILGASVTHVVSQLTREFIILVITAILIATPVEWLLMDKWLQGFAYKVEFHWWMFAGTGFVATIIALLTISGHSIKAAFMNPIKSIRGE